MASEAASKGEPVLSLGVEGGGLSIYRTPLASGGWQFHQAGSSMFVDDHMDESWIPWTSDAAPMIQDALRSIAKNGSWVFYYPILIHPDYRATVKHLVLEIVRNLSAERLKTWRLHNRRRWQQYWRPEPRRRQGETDLFGNPT